MLGVVATRDDHHLLMLFVAEEAQGQGWRVPSGHVRARLVSRRDIRVSSLSARRWGLCRSTRGSVSWRAVR